MKIQKNFPRYLIVGVINTFFGWLIFTVAVLSGAKIWQALVASIFLGIVFNYLTFGFFVFGNLTLMRFLHFVSVYALICTINLIAVTGLITWISSVILAQALLAPPMAIISYLLLSELVFKNSDAGSR